MRPVIELRNITPTLVLRWATAGFVIALYILLIVNILIASLQAWA